MEKYCPKCDKRVTIDMVRKMETYSVKGMDITIKANVCTCPICKTEIWDPSIDDDNLRIAFNVYRKEKNLLMPEDIKEIRESYGLSQVNFARILGVGDKTIARYENGSIQDEAINNLILLVRKKENFITLFAKNKDHLPEEERARLERVILIEKVSSFKQMFGQLSFSYAIKTKQPVIVSMYN